MVSDLVMYGLYLTDDHKANLFNNVLVETISAKENNKTRHCKALIGVNKLKFILNYQSIATFEELQATVSVLVKQYHNFFTVDERPEKGERKIVDEQALLISDIIDSYLKDKDLNFD